MFPVDLGKRKEKQLIVHSLNKNCIAFYHSYCTVAFQLTDHPPAARAYQEIHPSRIWRELP